LIPASPIRERLPFSYARTLKEGSAIRDELIFSGEKLVIAAIMFLFASILKHAANDIPRYIALISEKLKSPGERTIDPVLFGHDIFEIMVSVVAFFAFLLGLLYAQMGIFMIANIASHRMKRHPEYKEDIIDATSFRKRLAEIDRMNVKVGSDNNNT
jgi:hypothetical protein